MHFEIDWLAKQKKAAASEQLLTRCYMGLRVNGRQLFRHENLLGAHQVNDVITVSAYPLALWFAANWWRVRWEPNATSDNSAVLHDWKMSHSLAAAGEGYAWPNLTFASDGENIQLSLKPTQENTGSLRYLERVDAWVPARSYEAGVEDLITNTLAQLDSKKEQTPLHELWQTICEERANSEIALQRQLEARLGYDPEEAPEALLATLARLASVHGKDAIQELACLGYETAPDAIKKAEQCLSESGEWIKLPLKSIRRFSELLDGQRAGQPWEKGRDAANAARHELGIDKGPLNTASLAELLEAPTKILESSQAARHLPIGIGEVADNGKAKVALGKTRKDARRFMAARLIADGIYAGEADNWLPCTDATTIRQKFQRAFAQEFLCPYNDLIEWMNATAPDEELMEAAAEHFEVSPLLINTVMVNHGHIPRSELEAFQQAV